MTSSASGASHPDIRVGDLVKATRKGDPEISMTGRVQSASSSKVSLPTYGPAHYEFWDFEVLDRPLPPISKKLLAGACAAYRAGRAELGHNVDNNGAAVKAVINFVREYDRNNNKESK